MKRRDFLGSVAALAGTGALAGCLSSPGNGGDGGGYGGGGGDGGEPTPTISDREIETTDADCGSGGDASVDYGDEAVLVTGSLSASDPCHHAEIRSADYDAEADRLTVSVVAVENEDADVCAQCLAAVEYEARIRFSGGLPGSVTVEHDGEEVATGSR